MNSCTYCNRRFSSSEELSNHLYNFDHTKTYYKCPYNECNQEHTMKCNINRHLKMYHQTYINVEPVTVMIRLAGKNMTL